MPTIEFKFVFRNILCIKADISSYKVFEYIHISFVSYILLVKISYIKFISFDLRYILLSF